MTSTIPEELHTGTHRVNFTVTFPGNYTVDRVDARFTYKRLNSKLRALCRKESKTVEQIVSLVIKKI